MTQITIRLKNKEEETFVEAFLKKMKIRFEKKEDDDFELTDEMKRVVDEALKEDKSKFKDAFEVLEQISQKYGI
jgi:hypothetical protein